MAYSTRIIKDSLGPSGKRITTWLLSYPRFVHSELMTHRQFSRNSASSRAIPIQKMISRVWHDPVLPVWWGRNQKGMQAKEELTGLRKRAVVRLWLLARLFAIAFAWLLWKLDLHKQIANRLLEPWLFITVVVTTTEHANWFHLRRHPDAQPEIQWVANDMWEKWHASVPTRKRVGEWHLPFIDDAEHTMYMLDDLKKIAVGRLARVSYLTHEGVRNPSEDVVLCERLAASGHWSPFEHVARPTLSAERCGNFTGWMQYRKFFANEVVEDD